MHLHLCDSLEIKIRFLRQPFNEIGLRSNDSLQGSLVCMLAAVAMELPSIPNKRTSLKCPSLQVGLELHV